LVDNSKSDQYNLLSNSNDIRSGLSRLSYDINLNTNIKENMLSRETKDEVLNLENQK
jgi:hypothetical protein